jgi:hypothetical protein
MIDWKGLDHETSITEQEVMLALFRLEFDDLNVDG